MLITVSGRPHSGKSTLLAGAVSDRSAYGFLTAECTALDGTRTGFQLVDSAGNTALLASVASDSELRVSRYGVELEGLEGFLDQLRAPRQGEVAYIDEVGQMELLSPRFEELVLNWWSRSEILIVTLSEVFEHPLIDRLLDQADIHIEITPETREQAAAELRAALG